MKLPSSLNEKIGPIPLWGWIAGIAVLAIAKKHWAVGGITGGGIQGGPMGILGGGVGGYGDGWGCDEDGYCGGGGEGGGGGGQMGGGGGGGHKKHKGGGGMGW